MSIQGRWTVAIALTLLPAIAHAQGSGPATGTAPTATMAGKAASRFPQPVRVGDLLGRKLLGPAESQPVLGRVSDVVRRPDGGTNLVVRLAGWFGLGTRLVAVPVEAVGLLGEHVALLDIKADDLRGLPAFDPAAASEIARDATIRVGLVKPFH